MSDENEISNPFPSVSRLCETLGLPESKFALGWRWVNAEIGQITAIPKSRGKVVATDGMMCIIQTEDGGFYFGHWDWFEPEGTKDVEASSAKATRKPRKSKVLIEFLA